MNARKPLFLQNIGKYGIQKFTCVFGKPTLLAAYAATHVPLPHSPIVVTQRRQAFWQHDGGNPAVAGSLDRFVTRARRLK
jgi:hypothetical protein